MPLIESLLVTACKAGVAKVKDDLISLMRERGTSETMARQLNAAYEKTDQDMGRSAYNAARALLAAGLRRYPEDAEVLGLMAEAAESPGFAARAVRLLEAARRSPSEKRREMLAAVLCGLPFSSVSEDDRDRVDMLVKRLMPSDITLLDSIQKFEAEKNDFKVRWKNGVYAVRMGGELRVVPGSRVPEDTFSEDLFAIPGLPRDRIGLVTLETLGLIELDSGNSRGPFPIAMPINMVNGVSTTPLAEMLLAALRAVSPEALAV